MDVETLEQRHGDYFAPTFVVTVGGDDLVRDLHLSVSKVNVDLKEKAAGRFSITIANAFDWEAREFVAGETEARVDLLELFAFGAEVEVKLGYGEPARLDTVLKGIVTELNTTFGGGGTPELEIAGFDGLYPLTVGKATRSWEDVPDSDAVAEIARIHGLTADIEATTPAKPRIDQNEETDFAFLEKLAERNGAIFYVAGDTLRFGPRKNNEGAEIVLPWGGGLVTFSPEANLAKQIAVVEVVGTSATTGEQIVGRAERGDEGGRDAGAESGAERVARALSDQPVLRIRAAVHTQEEADARAQAVLEERAQDFVTGSAECIGLPELRPDINVGFEGLGRGFSKTYWVSGVVHDISSGGFKTTISVEEPTI
ncbi:MAG: contractile injection system protein, VgrG/Pvc8 family [Pseudomonadota bacterium]